MKRNDLLHIHRHGNHDYIWNFENELVIDKNFNTNFYVQNELLRKEIKTRYPGSTVEQLLLATQEILKRNLVKNEDLDAFNSYIKSLYYLKREDALEVSREIYNPSAPSRLHSLYLTEKENLNYWITNVGDDNYTIYNTKIDGNIFITSDEFLPKAYMSFDQQIEKAKKYWLPKEIKNGKEILFQGKCKIKKMI